MPVPANDWRRSSPGAANGTRFEWREYTAPNPEWDHDHCLFCWAKFVPRTEEGKDWLSRDTHTIYFAGYATVESGEPGPDWVCRPCFDDFAEELEFEVTGSGPPGAG